MPVLSRVLSEDWRGLSVLYVCPLRALLNNLEPRVRGLAELVGRRASLWHGDVSQPARKAIRGDTPDFLLTTPESLEAILISRVTDPHVLLRSVRTVIVDELHAFAGDDRGTHLNAVLARISRIAGRELQRIGLSATIGNPDELLDWLAAGNSGPRRVIAAGDPPGTSEVVIDHVGSLSNAAHVVAGLHGGQKRLVFCDSRARVEELATALRERDVVTFVSHGSLGVDERRRAEEAFATATDCVIVATSTLELGLDVGDLDRVIQIDAPGTVAAFLQRMGRTGRRPGIARNTLFLATTDEALLVAASITTLAAAGEIEPIAPPPLPYHLFAQQLLAMSLQERRISLGESVAEVLAFRFSTIWPGTRRAGWLGSWSTRSGSQEMTVSSRRGRSLSAHSATDTSRS